jgi:MoxR-like ATPase
LQPVVSLEQVGSMIADAGRTFIAEALQDYIVALVATTRSTPDIRLGASPRGSLALARAARVRAAADGRNYVVPEDVKALAPAVLGHRIILDPEAELRGVTAGDLIADVLAAVPVPQIVSA